MHFLNNLFEGAVNFFFADFLDGLVKTVVQTINYVLIDPTHLLTLPFFWPLYTALLATAIAIMGATIAKELLMNMFEGIGDQDVHPLVIVKNGVEGSVLMFLGPVLMTLIAFPGQALLMSLITNIMGGVGALTVNVPTMLNLTDPNDPLFTNWPIQGALLFVAIWVISAFWLAISTGMRIGELIFLALYSPFAAANRVSFGNQWTTWVRELTFITVAQPVQYLTFVMGISFLIHPKWADTVAGHPVDSNVRLFYLVGFSIFTIVGPKVLRKFITPETGNALKAMSSLAGAIK